MKRKEKEKREANKKTKEERQSKREERREEKRREESHAAFAAEPCSEANIGFWVNIDCDQGDGAKGFDK